MDVEPGQFFIFFLISKLCMSVSMYTSMCNSSCHKVITSYMTCNGALTPLATTPPPPTQVNPLSPQTFYYPSAWKQKT